MHRSVFILAILGLFLSSLPAPAHGKPLVLFVGGWRMTAAEMASFSRSVPAAAKVTYLLPDQLSELVRPWHCADLVYTYLQKNNLVDEELLVVSYSLGGVVTQWLLRSHPELQVKKLILVGSPIGGYKFIPPNNYFSNRFPQDLPIYVIAGDKSQNVWFLRDTNDGVVDLDSAFAISDQNLQDGAIFSADHPELLALPEVQAQLAEWLDLGQEPTHNFVAGDLLQPFTGGPLPFAAAIPRTTKQ